MKPKVTIELSEYQNLLDFQQKSKSKRMFIFDEYLNVCYFADKDFSVVKKLEEEIKREQAKYFSLYNRIKELERPTFKQKLKNLFR